MTTENPSINSVNQKKQNSHLKKRLAERNWQAKIVVDVVNNMTKNNALHKEKDVPSVKNWTILPVFRNLRPQFGKEYTM